jgi:hypothetical protein
VNRRLALLAIAVVGLTVGCSSTSSSGGSAASTTTSIDPAATTTTTLAVTTTTAPAATTTVVVTVAPTVAPAPPVTNAPKPPSSTAAPAPAAPRLDSVSLPTPVPSCNPGDQLTITIQFSTTNAAGVTVWSSFDGDLGQFPAEYGSVDVPYTCISGQALYTFYPVAEGGALGSPVDLYV